MKNNKGFTLIELLVVIAIIGLLANIAMMSINNARQKSRDAKRVSDIKEIQTALEMYFSTVNSYPSGTIASTVQNGTLGVSPRLTFSSTNGFNTTAGTGIVFMGKVPADPGSNTYTYSSTNGSSYSLTFTLEGKAGSLASGAHAASPTGIQ